MINYEIYVTGLLIAWMFVNFDPIQDFIKNRVIPLMQIYKCNKSYMASYFTSSLSCFKCMSFWGTLIVGSSYYEFAILEAILAAVTAYTYTRLMSSFKTYL